MQPATSDRRGRATSTWRGLAIALALFAVVAAPLWHLHIINRQMPPSHSDFVQIWIGTRAMLNGHSPYSDQTTRDIQTLYYGRPLTSTEIGTAKVNTMHMAYPAYATLVFAPVAVLSWEHTRLGFLLLVPLLMAISVPLWLRVLRIPISPVRTAIITVLFFGFWPMMWALRLQQATLLVAFVFVAGCLLLQRRWDASAGLLFALTAVKPQLAGPLLLWLLVWAVLQRRWRFVATFVGWMSLLVLTATWMVPGWVPQWFAVMTHYSQVTHPVFSDVFGRWIGSTANLAAAVFSAMILWHLRACDANSREFGIAVSLALAIPTVLIPTYPPMVYNQVLLLPAFLLLIHTRPADYYPALARRICIAFLVYSFAVTILAVLGESLLHPSNLWDALPFETALLPAVCLVALLFLAHLQTKLTVETLIATPTLTATAALS